MDPISITVLTGIAMLICVVVPAALFLYRKILFEEQFRLLPMSRAKVAGDRSDDASVDALLVDFIDEWARTFGDPMRLVNGFMVLRILWVRGEFFTDAGHPGEKLTGLTMSETFIEVADKNGAPVGKTALAHELCHVALWLTTGDPDRDHAIADGHAATWTLEHNALIERVNARYR